VFAFVSVYQGGIIMILAIILFERNFSNIVSITFTSLILCELLNVALEVHQWHGYMIGAQLLSIVIYIASLFVLDSYFGRNKHNYISSIRHQQHQRNHHILN
jgi:phospholipid-translocating ATPase